MLMSAKSIKMYSDSEHDIDTKHCCIELRDTEIHRLTSLTLRYVGGKAIKYLAIVKTQNRCPLVKYVLINKYFLIVKNIQQTQYAMNHTHKLF